MSPRKFDSEIKIDPYDRWIFRGNEITKEEILRYFRENLHQTEEAVYIQNVFGNLSEHGFLEIQGYPCHVLHLEIEGEELLLYCDDGKQFRFPDFEIYQTKEGALMGIHSSQPLVKYRFTWNAAKELGDILEESNDSIYFKFGEIKMELPIYEGEVPVPLPNSYGSSV
ncbi:hypothetical protein LPTSP4_22410 [Leptospira ryugenii]|uniref:Uncharacterized protein n=1 Tax=Leptospira ryugenii TaxID=1917863 RepID=A0A2P2E1H1_9LEPT|nr:hypothetical protein [Leptospira ryugenii]GBF50714.1 hypothetical protein LPTSP4_22410 [Leptospira ryugenii]